MKQSKFNVGDQVTVNGLTGNYTVGKVTYENQFDTYEYELLQVPNSVVVEECLQVSTQYDDMGTYYTDMNLLNF